MVQGTGDDLEMTFTGHCSTSGCISWTVTCLRPTILVHYYVTVCSYVFPVATPTNRVTDIQTNMLYRTSMVAHNGHTSFKVLHSTLSHSTPTPLPLYSQSTLTSQHFWKKLWSGPSFHSHSTPLPLPLHFRSTPTLLPLHSHSILFWKKLWSDSCSLHNGS